MEIDIAAAGTVGMWEKRRLLFPHSHSPKVARPSVVAAFFIHEGEFSLDQAVATSFCFFGLLLADASRARASSFE